MSAEHARLHGPRASTARRRRPLAHTARFRFVRDGFHVWAFLLAPFWMLRHRLWLEFDRLGADRRSCRFAAAAIWHCRQRRLLGCAAARAPDRHRGFVACGAGSLRGVALPIVASWSARILRTPSGVSSTAGPMRHAVPRRAGTAAARADSVRSARYDRHRRTVPASGGAAMTVAIVDYGSGNLHSAAKAFERAARESGHDQPILVTDDPDQVRGRRSHRAARRRRVRGLPPRARCGAGHGRGAERDGAKEGPAVPRHLRRHAADGGTRPRV